MILRKEMLRENHGAGAALYVVSGVRTKAVERLYHPVRREIVLFCSLASYSRITCSSVDSLLQGDWYCVTCPCTPRVDHAISQRSPFGTPVPSMNVASSFLWHLGT